MHASNRSNTRILDRFWRNLGRSSCFIDYIGLPVVIWLLHTDGSSRFFSRAHTCWNTRAVTDGSWATHAVVPWTVTVPFNYNTLYPTLAIIFNIYMAHRHVWKTSAIYVLSAIRKVVSRIRLLCKLTVLYWHKLTREAYYNINSLTSCRKLCLSFCVQWQCTYTAAAESGAAWDTLIADVSESVSISDRQSDSRRSLMPVTDGH